jgi:hypothetical protein
MTDEVDVPPEVPSLPEPPATAKPQPAEPGDPNPPLPDPGPRDGTHTHDGTSPNDPDIGEAFADGFDHPDK